MTKLSRRAFLRAGVAGTVGASLLGPFTRAKSSPAAAPTRLILFPSLNGTRHPDFWPGADGRLQAITSPLEPLRDHVTFVRGLSMSGSWDHFAIRSMFTGAPIMSYADPEPAVPSFDQRVADAIGTTPVRSLHLGARPAQYQGAAFNGRQNIFRTADEAVRVYANPVSAFDTFVGSVGVPPPTPPTPEGPNWEAEALAITQAELTDLRGRGLGPSQQRKLDVHASAVSGMIDALEPGDVVLPGPMVDCSGPVASVEALRGSLQGNDAAAYEDRYFPDIVDAQVDIIARAVTCGLTYVATLQSSWADGDVTVPVESGERLPWHPTSHDRPEAYALLQKWYVGKLVRLATQLDAPDPLDSTGSSTVLDNTVIVWMSECEPSHSADEISAMLVGGRCAGLNTGGVVTGSSNLQLLRTLCEVFGVDGAAADQFGSSTITELLA